VNASGVDAATALEPTTARTASGSPADAGTTADPVARTGLLACIADPVRWSVLAHLSAGESCVCDIQARVPVAANLLSYHLRVLREAGLILARKRGRWVDYRLATDAHQRLYAALPVPAASADASVSRAAVRP
jgi:ArsR family transcriptional regulator, arsenate/arsenite/antimonite-responsive transcriptional repressor